MEIERTYSLVEISRILGRPRTTLISWMEIFREFIPTIGSGRTMRYKEEAIEVFSVIAKMKDRGEPNELIRKVLQDMVTEITIHPQEIDQQKTFFGALIDSYDELMIEMTKIKSQLDDLQMMMTNMARRFDELSTKDDLAHLESTSKEHMENLLHQTQQQTEDWQRWFREQMEKHKEEIRKITEESVANTWKIESSKRKKGWFSRFLSPK